MHVASIARSIAGETYGEMVLVRCEEVGLASAECGAELPAEEVIDGEHWIARSRSWMVTLRVTLSCRSDLILAHVSRIRRR